MRVFYAALLTKLSSFFIFISLLELQYNGKSDNEIKEIDKQ